MHLVTYVFSNKKLVDSFLIYADKKYQFHAKRLMEILPFVQITDLIVNITKHVLKPKHQVLTAKQKKNLLKKYNIEEKQVSWFNLGKAYLTLIFIFIYFIVYTLWCVALSLLCKLLNFICCIIVPIPTLVFLYQVLLFSASAYATDRCNCAILWTWEGAGS